MTQMILESDSAEVVSELNRDGGGRSQLSAVCRDIKLFLEQLLNFKINKMLQGEERCGVMVFWKRQLHPARWYGPCAIVMNLLLPNQYIYPFKKNNSYQKFTN
jgi:hypothetical protein